jgi:PKHD-type hydroxylase
MLLVIDNVLSKAEVAHFRERLDGAEWSDGRKSAGSIAATVKHNVQLEETSSAAIALGERILRTLGQNPTFVSSALPEKIYPPKFNRYAGGDHYGAHVDSAVMRIARAGVTLRADLSATLFLSEPEEYEGGVLTIEGAYGAQEIKLAAGDLVLYPACSLHQVSPVTAGARLAAFFWVQSMVADLSRRSLLYDLDQAIQGLRAREGTACGDEILRLTGVYNNLLRLWAAV